MNQKEIFEMALGLEGTPWYVASVEFDKDRRRLDITLDYPPLSRFAHPTSNAPCSVYDSAQRSWRHLNFFQFECYLHAFVPRVDGGGKGEGGIKTVNVPWARPHSGFTLLMEALLTLMTGTGMTVQEVAEVIGEYAQRVWKVLFHHVGEAHAKMDLSQVQTLSIDEVSRKKGHHYITVISEPGNKDLGQPSRVLLVTEGKDAQAVRDASAGLTTRGLDLLAVKNVCLDMSAAFISGAKSVFINAALIFDHFHVIQLLTKAIDEIRRRERHSFPEELKNSRWLLLKAGEKLSKEETLRLAQIRRGHSQTGKAYNMLDSLRLILRDADVAEAEACLWRWTSWPLKSRIPEMQRVAQTIRDHFEGIAQFLRTRVTNAAAEALNGIIQTVKRKSRGFRSIEYFQTMIYLVASHLTFDLPNPVPVTHTKS